VRVSGSIGWRCRGQGGAITVFLIIIMTSLLILAGLIVDAARILVAERKVDNALHSAVRSVLAQGNSALAGQFGLYGVNYASKNEELARYLRNNLVERHEGFAFVDYRIDKAVIESGPEQTLLNNEAFEQQVLQYMKYKAPLRLSENVAEKFRMGALSKKSQAGASAVGAAKQSKAVRHKAIALNKNLCSKGGAFQRGAPKRLKDLQSLQEELTLIKGELKTYQQAVLQGSTKLSEAAQATGQEYSGLNAEAEIGQLEEQVRTLDSSISANVKLLEEIIPSEEELDSLKGVEGEDAANRRRTLTRQIQVKASNWQNLAEVELPWLKQAQLTSQDIKAKQKLLRQISSLFGANLASPEISSWLISAEDFGEANTAIPAAAITSLDFTNPEADLAAMDLSNDLAEASGLSLFKLTDKLAEGLEQSLLDGGTRLALGEYIMDKYTFATSQTERGHYFALGEVEYILCGQTSELANVSEMFLKIFVIRLAIDTLDIFLKSPLPHPAVRLAEALVSGFSMACTDMLKLYQGQSIALCPSSPQPVLAYSDYLRLFLLLQEKNQQLERMRQVLQVDVRKVDQSFALKQHSSCLSVHSEISINLLFLPVLHLDKLGFPGFSQNRYSLAKKITAGY